MSWDEEQGFNLEFENAKRADNGSFLFWLF